MVCTRGDFVLLGVVPALSPRKQKAASPKCQDAATGGFPVGVEL